MHNLRAFWIRLMGLFSSRSSREFETELENHVDLHVRDGVNAGLSQEEARRNALIRLGGAEQTRQAYRERATLPKVEDVLRDFRFGARQMLKSPAFSLTAILTLALGIGANAVIYTLVDSILLRPLPYEHQEELMRIAGTTETGLPKGWIRAMSTHTHAFASLAGFGPDAESNVADGDRADRVFGAKATVNAFDTLGIHPAIGQFFTPEDAIAGRDHDVVVSYGYWRQRFGEDPSVIGKQIRIDGVSRRIIGVMPAGVRFPYADTQFVIPVSFRGDNPFDPWTDFDLREFGRLAPGVTPAQAQADLRRLHSILLPIFPWRMPDIWASDMTVVPLLEAQTGAMRPKLLLLFGAVGLILLIACANVANLMLARSTARERELAIRGALGASGRRLIQQLLSESLLMGLAAGLVGLAAAYFSLREFVSLLPADTPRMQDVALRWHDVLFTLGASILAGLLFGIIPAIKSVSLNLLSTLRMGGRGLVGKQSRFGISTLLVMAQIGLSVVVITSAGLMLRSLYKLSHVDPGFRTDHTVTAEISLDDGACKEKGRCRAFFDTLLNRMQGITGVENAALASALPFGGPQGNYVFDAEDHPRDPRAGALLATGRNVTPQYFAVLDLHLVRGRLLNAQDMAGATHAVVVNERMAQHLWPNQNPIGKHVLAVGDEPTPAVWSAEKASVVVGVVRNVHDSSLDGGFDQVIYLPVTSEQEKPVMYALLRSHVSPSETAAGLRNAVSGIDSLVPVTRVRTMDEIVTSSMASPRALAVLLLGFGLLAVFIGSAGVYSLIEYIVGWRVREIGLRLALGAQRWQILLAVVRQSLILAGGGCIAGLLASIALGRALRSFLFEVSPFDALTFCAVAALMATIALIAAWMPARRAAAVDPMEALRIE